MTLYRAALASSFLLILLPGCKTDVQPETSDLVTVPSSPSTPTPAPSPSPTPAPSPVGPLGAAAIASNFNVSSTLQAAWGTGAIASLNGSDTVGAFRFICGAGQLSYDDPIVFPGQPGKSHLHQFYGNTTANANSTFASLRASGDSTCNNMGNGTAANRSAYWMPAMLDGKGHIVLPDYVQVYYKREPDNSEVCQNNTCIGIPNGLKFIQGFNMANGDPGSHPGNFHCTGSGAVTSVQANLVGMKAKCPAGAKLAMAISSLKCWNGRLDSADHRSHFASEMRNESTGWVIKCPSTHPYLLPKFTITSFYSVKTGDDLNLWSLSSDAMYPNLPKGTTMHFDYFEAWDTLVKDMWVDNCIGEKRNCSGGDLGNGKQLRGASQPEYGWSNPARLVPVAARAAP